MERQAAPTGSDERVPPGSATTVHIVNPVALHIERARVHARDRGLEERITASVGDARDLTSFGTGYDAVLLLGPLYHLVDAEDRAVAWREAARVVSPVAS